MASASIALLPIFLAIIMFSLGLTIRVSDVTALFYAPVAFMIGIICQLLLLPLATFMLIFLFQPSPELAFGFMLLSFCPGGVSSNILCNLVNGNLPLSIALTSVTSLLSIILVPIFTVIAYQYFLGNDAQDISMVTMGLQMFAITAVPAAIGIAMNETMPEFIDSVRVWFVRVSIFLFFLLVVAAIISNRQTLMQQFGTIGVMTITLIVMLFVTGFGVAKLFGLNMTDAKTIGLEVGIQNSAMAMALAGLISAVATEVLPTYALPAAVYSVLMYVVVVPYVLFFREKA